MQLTTTSTEWALIDTDLQLRIDTIGDFIGCTFGGLFTPIGKRNAAISLAIAVDGKLLPDSQRRWSVPVSGQTWGIVWPIAIPAGEYHIAPYWRLDSGQGVQLTHLRLVASE